MPIQIKGKPYYKVDERMMLADNDAGFSMLSSEIFECKGRYFYKMIIEVKGKPFIGTAEVRFDAHPSSADGMAPVECAETSALGRALRFAGYGG